MLITRAGLRLSGTLSTCSPAAHRMPSTISDTVAPHLPATRTGSTVPPQLMPATPVPLLVAAATRPAMMVPCQLLLVTSQSLNSGLLAFSLAQALRQGLRLVAGQRPGKAQELRAAARRTHPRLAEIGGDARFGQHAAHASLLGLRARRAGGGLRDLVRRRVLQLDDQPVRR